MPACTHAVLKVVDPHTGKVFLLGAVTHAGRRHLPGNSDLWEEGERGEQKEAGIVSLVCIL